MLYVDGMNGVINHNETIQWLYTLIGSKVRQSPKFSFISFLCSLNPFYLYYLDIYGINRLCVMF